ncbi:MAG: NAD-dependent epimerase/dehydratase [Parcubacteria group bacterium Athens0714_26]|nr:MAG: NAD-dependent epimerase/dehydratase [Parcubacteria group bacterium Athens1014_26]TSD03644.1 MAG: NAD-dependent epimerase/dehydratase [Parcubacteria group bacterium Athens0714_26]
MNKNIFVTGGCGFIGSHLVKRLIEGGYGVHILIRPASDLWRIKDVLSKLKIHYGDLSDFNKLKDIVRNVNPVGIFHLAASPIMSGVMASTEEVVKSNFLGTVNLINAAEEINYKFFINTGSFFEYGPKKTILKEIDICEPAELYSITKLAGTLYGQAIAKSKNKPIVTFRLAAPYGPYIQKGRLIYNVIINALQDKDISLTSPEITRDFIFVEDVINLYMEAMEKAENCKGEIFNLGTGNKTTIKMLVDYVLKIAGSKSRVNWNAFHNVVYDNGLWQTDMNKTFSKFLWRPEYDIENGLEKTIKWFKDNLDFLSHY